jgi:hypothetical protein
MTSKMQASFFLLGAYSLILKVEAVFFSEMSVDV